MSALDPVLRRWPILAFAASAAMLIVAHGFQSLGHLEPCHLCLEQRQVYWAALPVSGVAAILLASPRGTAARRIGGAVLVLVFAYGAYLAAFQAGAEWKWWPAPATCSSTGPVSLHDLGALLGGAAARPPACDVAAWVFLGLSMAGWNFLIQLALIALSALSALTPARRP